MTNAYLSTLGPALANHLWQSTLFAAVVWLMTLLLRNNQARIRYTLWLAASIKFLLPFSLLITLGTLLPKPQRISTQSTMVAAIDTVNQPFSEIASPIPSTPQTPNLKDRLATQLPAALAALWLTGALTALLIWYKRWRQVHATLKKSIPLTEGRELEILHRLQRKSNIDSQSNTRNQIALLHSQELMEPGIFGIFHPVLLWPARLSDQLEDEHIEAILVHESIHVQRHDNLTAALHMLVEAIFWFHPIVWWMEHRMIEERERACDEAVVQQGGNPETYAESLLKACRFCLESPLPCVAGITGADLTRRVRSIMTLQLEKLGTLKKLLLAALGLAVLAGPLAFGMMQIPTPAQSETATLGSPSFEVATIRPGNDASGDSDTTFSRDRYEANNKALIDIIRSAYGITANGKDQLLGGPGWINSTKFDIKAKLTEADFAELQKLNRDQQLKQMQLMLQSLLADRFNLKVHHETKELPLYTLTVAKSGSKLTPSSPSPTQKQHGVRAIRGQITGMDTSLDTFAKVLGMQPEIGRNVLDKTGLTGNYDFTLQWTPEAMASGDATAPSDSTGPSLFTALQEQLGLKLESTKGPVDVLIIDHIERPTGDAGGEAPTQAADKPITQTHSKMAFEVTSIRRNTAANAPVQFGQTPDGFHSIGLPMFAIFQLAYAPSEGGPLRGDRIAGDPNWLKDERYDVVAKVNEADLADWQKPQLKQTMLRAMLQAMLAERCKVVVHQENKEVPVYNLVVAKGGPRFKPAKTVDIDELKRKYPNGGRVTGGGLAVHGPDGIQFYGISMAMLAQTVLPSVTDRPVVDKTGLTGRYDLAMPWSALPRQPNAPPPDDESIFTTLPQALGLRLEPAKGQVEKLVIDHAERPTEN